MVWFFGFFWVIVVFGFVWFLGKVIGKFIGWVFDVLMNFVSCYIILGVFCFSMEIIFCVF